jgi:hypothetical protein
VALANHVCLIDLIAALASSSIWIERRRERMDKIRAKAKFRVLPKGDRAAATKTRGPRLIDLSDLERFKAMGAWFNDGAARRQNGERRTANGVKLSNPETMRYRHGKL